jgi:hypothetical protein
MLAAAIFDALKAGDISTKMLSAFPAVEQKLHQEGTVAGPQFSPSFQHGMLSGFVHAAFNRLPAGALIDPMRAHPGYEAYKKINGRPALEIQGRREATFDRLTDVITLELGMKRISRVTSWC